jgi:glutamate 5-kinase
MASGKGGKFGRGGMLTKLKAATRAGRSGAATLIVSGRIPEVLMKVAAGENLGTLLHSAHAPLAARKQWLASHLKVRGELHLDAGAVTVLQHGGKSLLPIGVTQATGQFTRGDMVACLAPDGTEIARGFINYPVEETQKILRQASDKIEQILGYVDEPELIHRDNLVLV